MENNFIHPTAICTNVTFNGGGNYVGPYSVIRNAVIGHNNVFRSHSCIGGDPEVAGFRASGDYGYGVIIGSDNEFGEFTTAHAGHKAPTIIDHGNLFFRHVHIAHDCIIGTKNIVGGGASLSGHVKLLGDCFIAGGSTIHQFVVVGRGAMVGCSCHIEKHVAPYLKVASRGAAVIGHNERTLGGLSDADVACANLSFLKEIERNDPTNRTTEIRAFSDSL